MSQWKKLLGQGKLIKKVTLKGRLVSISLQDEIDDPANYVHIKFMFYNIWKNQRKFNEVFERIRINNDQPTLILRNENHYTNAQEVLNALVDFGNTNVAYPKKKRVSAKNFNFETDEEGVKSPKLQNVKQQQKREERHPWKKLLSSGELIESLDIKGVHVYVKLATKYNEKHFFPRINAMLHALYQKSDDLKNTFQKPALNSRSPCLILFSKNTNHDPSTLLNILINNAKQSGLESSVKSLPVAAEVSTARNEPLKPTQPGDNDQDNYDDIFKDDIFDDFNYQGMYSVIDYRPLQAFENSHGNKAPSQQTNESNPLPVDNNQRRVPIIRLKITRAT